MIKESRRNCSLVVLAVPALLLCAANASAGWRDCGQPSSTAAAPTTTDARTVLGGAVGAAGPCDLRPCVCDVSGDGSVTASDALRTLKFAVGQDVALACDCPPPPPPCTSATLTVMPGSEYDYGWTGIAHDDPVSSGFSIEVNVVRRCTSDNSVCTGNGPCPAGGTCVPTCDCNTDPTCELVSSATSKHCLSNLDDCETNADCPSGVACVEVLPPLPVSSGGTPVCRTNVLTTPLTGTVDVAAGEMLFSTGLFSRIALGIRVDMPCPQCGAPQDDPKLGDTFVCSGGQFQGAVCQVDAVHPVFGGTSYDCPADLSASISESGRVIPLRAITTGTTTRTAQLPCANFFFRHNPLYPASNPKCTDRITAEDPVCTSNADCRRCTGDATIACEEDGDCTGHGTCAEAPDQPVTCGYWCHCGFCDGNAGLPCFESAECPQGQTCMVGPGIGTAQNAPQQKPNDCSHDNFICGQDEPERCASTPLGECSEQPYRNCLTGSTACEDNLAGRCVITARPCFEPRITRSGDPSPLGRYCALQDKACSSNGDCAGAADFCVDDSARPETVALACIPGSSSSSINNVGGITGPAALQMQNRLVFHRSAAAASTTGSQ